MQNASSILIRIALCAIAVAVCLVAVARIRHVEKTARVNHEALSERVTSTINFVNMQSEHLKIIDSVLFPSGVQDDAKGQQDVRTTTTPPPCDTTKPVPECTDLDIEPDALGAEYEDEGLPPASENLLDRQIDL